MFYIDPHIHMVSRITDDYVRMSRAGCVAVSEPVFEADSCSEAPIGVNWFPLWFASSRLTSHTPRLHHFVSDG